MLVFCYPLLPLFRSLSMRPSSPVTIWKLLPVRQVIISDTCGLSFHICLHYIFAQGFLTTFCILFLYSHLFTESCSQVDIYPSIESHIAEIHWKVRVLFVKMMLKVLNSVPRSSTTFKFFQLSYFDENFRSDFIWNNDKICKNVFKL